MSDNPVTLSFSVREPVAFMAGTRLVAKYLPEMRYRVTALNQAFVREQIEKGNAVLSSALEPTHRMVISAEKAKLEGRVSVGDNK